MYDKIVGVLHELERQQDFKVLFAAESGSRAWGFASPDSDYDVRMIYVKPEAWYWSLDAKQPDTFNAMQPGELDVSAWELRKTLRLFAGCNPSLNEWLGSPIIYYADPKFADETRSLIPVYFNPGPFFYFPEKFSPPQTGEFFESQKEEHFHFSKNSPGETGTSFCLKKEFEHRENGRKEIRTSDLYS